MTVKYSTFASGLHERGGFLAGNEAFLHGLEEVLGEPLIQAPLSDYACELKLIFIESGGSEGLFLRALPSLRPPYYFLTSGDHNSLAATLEIGAYLAERRLPFEILHGDREYICGRIRALARKSADPAEEAAQPTRLGVIGRPSDWLIASVPDYGETLRKLGCELIDVPMEDFLALCEKAPKEPPAEFADAALPPDALPGAGGICAALETLVREKRLDGLTLRCFDLLDSVRSTGCYALAKLNARGIPAACEGDIASLLSMVLIRRRFGQSAFQANPSRFDLAANEAVFAHCTVPFDLVSEVTPLTHFESGIGLGLRGRLREEDVTIFRLAADLRRWYLAEGRIVENLSDEALCRTQIRVRLDQPLSGLLSACCGNHQLIFYGRHKDEMEEYLKKLPEDS